MDEPYVLCSQALNDKGKCRVSSVAYPSRLNQHKRVCVAASGVGATFYDITDQTAVSALTLGPSFVPTTAVASRSKLPVDSALSKAKFVRKTWVAVEASARAELWTWHEDEKRDGSVADQAQKATVPLDQKLVALHAPRSLQDHLLALRQDGTFQVLSEHDAVVLTSVNAPTPSKGDLVSQSLKIVQLRPDRNQLCNPSLRDALPQNNKAHFVFVSRTRATAQSVTPKKGKRPTSAMIIDGQDVERSYETEIELLLLDPKVFVDGEENLGVVSLGNAVVPSKDVAISDDGYVSWMERNELVSKRIQLSPTLRSSYASIFEDPDCSISIVEEPATTVPLSDKTLALDSISLLGLHSSFVLMTAQSARTTTDDRSLHAVIWDVQLGLAAAAQSVSIPANAVGRQLTHQLGQLDARNAFLSVSPSTEAGRCIVFVLPLTLPDQSDLAAVIGQQSAVRHFVVHDPSTRPQEYEYELAPEEKVSDPYFDQKRAERKAARSRLIEQLRPLSLANERDRREMDRLFVQYLDEDNRRSQRSYIPPKQGQAERSAKYVEAEAAIEKTIKNAAKKGKSWQEAVSGEIEGVPTAMKEKFVRIRLQDEKRDSQKQQAGELERLDDPKRWQHVTHFDLFFIQDIISICFPDALDVDRAKKSAQYPAFMVRYLIDQGYLCESDIEGGLVKLLISSGDWDNVELAIARVPDVSAEVVVTTLQEAIRRFAASQDGRTLPQFLARFLDQPFTSSELRPALKQILTSEEALIVMHVLDSWLERWTTVGFGGGRYPKPFVRANPYKPEEAKWTDEKPESIPANVFHTLLAEPPSSNPGADLPAVDDILPLVEALLDAHFVNLLLLKDAHPVLARLDQHVAKHLRATQGLSSLLGILSIYSKEWSQRKPKTRSKNKKDRHRARPAIAADGGAGLDEQELFKAKMEKRAAWTEKHSEPSMYAVERLQF